MNGATLIVSLLSSLIPVLMFVAAGSSIGRGPARLPGADMLVGFGAAGSMVIVLAVITRAPLTWLMAGTAAGAFVLAAVRRQLPGGMLTWVSLALLSPLLLKAAGTPAFLWDEVWHWLPSAAYEYTNNSLPWPDLPASFSKWPGYPQSFPLTIAGASFVAGSFLEAAGPVLNVALIAAACALITDSIEMLRARSGLAPLSNRYVMIAFVTFAVVVVNPGISGDILLSSYTDSATGVMVLALALLAIAILTAATAPAAAGPGALAWRFGFVGAALVNLKQANPILLALIVASIAAIALFDKRVSKRALLMQLPRMLGPAVVVFLVWRWYIAQDPPGTEMAFRRLSAWNWDVVSDIFGSVWRYTLEMPLFYAMAWGVAAVGIWSLIRLRWWHSEIHWLAAMTGLVWVGYNVFLFLVYLGAMTREEAKWAADYWRYTPHVALLAFAAPLIALAARPWPKWLSERAKIAAVVGAVLALSAAFVRPDYGVTRQKKWASIIRSVTADIRGMIPPGSTVVLPMAWQVNPYPNIVAYDLWQLGDPKRQINTRAIWNFDELDKLKSWLEKGEVTHLLIHGARPKIEPVAEKVGVPPPARNEMAFYEWRGGQWVKMKSWPIIPPDLIEEK